MRVLTLSATYGAGGSVVAVRLAERLGLNLVQRIVRSMRADEVREEVRDELAEGLTTEERDATPSNRWLVRLAHVPAVVMAAPVPGPYDIDPDPALRGESETIVARALELGDTLVLGRAAAVVLAEKPGAFHVRLDGPPALRLRRAMEIEGIDEARARRRQSETDRARALFVRRLYDRDPRDPSLYHLVVTSTAFGLDEVVDLVAGAACTFWARPGEPGG